MRFTVIQAWSATYKSPIELRAGDRIDLSGHEDDWEGHTWLWAKSHAGTEGWIPDTLVVRCAEKTLAVDDYSAMELTCQRGQILTALQDTHGWILCRAANGAKGWVPKSHLEPINE